MKGRMKDKMTEKMKRERGDFFSKKCFKTLKSAR